MTFPGRFAEQIVPEELHRISLSFLVDSLDVRRGGNGANICFGLGSLGLRPLLVGAAGHDFADYRSWLDRHGIDTHAVHVSAEQHTARFVCTTDEDHNQLASFYPGAMTEARLIELLPIAERCGGLDLVVVSPNDPEAMTRHTVECSERGYPFVADPSQQLPRLERADARQLIDGADYLFANEYEKALIEHKTGWSGEDVLGRVGVRVTTHGPDGVVIERKGARTLRVSAVPPTHVADPTGAGDSFRAGFLAGLAWQLSLDGAARVGALLATYTLENLGTQEYEIEPRVFVERLAKAYGDDAAAEVEPHLRGMELAG